MPGVKSQREQYARRVEILGKRLNTLVPDLMEEEDIDLWVGIGGDYNEEPVVAELTLASPILRVMIAIHKGPDGLKLYSDGPEGGTDHVYYTGIRRQGEDSFQALGRLIREIDPRKIAVNESPNFCILDGLTHNYYKRLVAAIGPKYEERIVSAQHLAMRFMETRLDEELGDYEHVCEMSRRLIYEAFTPSVVVAGTTTTADVEWWIRQWTKDHGMDYNWGPNVNVQREGDSRMMAGLYMDDFVIEGGDLLHVDFGIRYMGYETDMQFLAYVLKPGETEAPKGLVKAFERCLLLQDIYLKYVRPGKRGNETWRELLARAKEAGLSAMVYSHPIGYRAHGVGPTIGRFRATEDILPNGEIVVSPNTCFAMELNVRERIPEWNDQEIYIFTEDQIVVEPNKTRVLGQRQEELILI